MCFLTDLKYLMILAPRLDKFTDKGNHVYNCRCSICGDSAKNKIKARGYFYETPKGISFKCHNCGICCSFRHFLSETDPSLFNQYVMESFNDSNRLVGESRKSNEKTKHGLILDLPELEGESLEYARSRGIPEIALKRLRYSENFKNWAVSLFGEKYHKLDDSPRLVLPFYDLDGNFVGAQGRSLNPKSKFRYETVKAEDCEYLIFGLDVWNRNKLTKVVEGPIDSLFIDNCLATANSDLSKVIKKLAGIDKDNLIFIWDNEPRNKEILKLMNAAITNGYTVFFWPADIKGKDVNDACFHGVGFTDDFILSNAYSGLSAKLKFTEWAKISI